MKLNIKGRNVEVTDALRDYVEKRFNKLEKYFTNELSGTVTLIVEKNNHVAEATIPINRFILRAEEASEDMYASIDSIVEKIERQIRKYKTRINRRGKQNEINIGAVLAQAEEVGAVAEEKEEEDKIVKIKRFSVRMMDPEEAIMQMELLDHDFFVFLNADTDNVDVVYRRHDGKYGLIQPEVE